MIKGLDIAPRVMTKDLPRSPEAKLGLYELKDVLVWFQLEYFLSIKMERVKDEIIHVSVSWDRDAGFYESEIWRKTMRVKAKLVSQEEMVEKLYFIINDRAGDVEHDS